MKILMMMILLTKIAEECFYFVTIHFKIGQHCAVCVVEKKN